MLDNLIESALELFFPSRCSGCDGPCPEGAAFCRICDISVLGVDHACARCALPTPRPVVRCLGCMARPPDFYAAWSAFEFGGAVAEAIRRLKWGNRPELARPLARLIPPPLPLARIQRRRAAGSGAAPRPTTARTGVQPGGAAGAGRAIVRRAHPRSPSSAAFLDESPGQGAQYRTPSIPLAGRPARQRRRGVFLPSRVWSPAGTSFWSTT